MTLKKWHRLVQIRNAASLDSQNKAITIYDLTTALAAGA